MFLAINSPTNAQYHIVDRNRISNGSKRDAVFKEVFYLCKVEVTIMLCTAEMHNNILYTNIQSILKKKMFQIHNIQCADENDKCVDTRLNHSVEMSNT